MDVKQIEYIVKIADEHSITRAAEKLYLTQSALNQQLLRLEKELGAQLFKRSKADWSPTPVGEVYLKNAREILRLRHETYNQISDMVAAKKGHLSIAFTPGRGSEMFTHIYPVFHKRYPNIIIEPHELSVRNQQILIAQGELDIGFQTLSAKQRTADSYIELGSEEIFLAVPEGHPAAMAATEAICNVGHEAQPEHETIRTAPGQNPSPFPVLDPALLQYEPFVLMYRESTIRAITDEIFRSSGFSPNVLFETASNQTVISMIQARLCCGVIPEHYIRKQPRGIACFSFPSHPHWDIVASYRKNAYLSEGAKTLIELVREYWS